MNRETGVSRREILKRLGMAGAAAFALPELSRVLSFRTRVFAQTPVLSAAESATLAAVCARATATAPADRYPTADELAKDIRRYLAGDSVAAYPETPLARWTRITRPVRPLLALLGLYGAIRLGIFFWSGD